MKPLIGITCAMGCIRRWPAATGAELSGRCAA